jgi:hypothetical protein
MISGVSAAAANRRGAPIAALAPDTPARPAPAAVRPAPPRLPEVATGRIERIPGWKSPAGSV